MKTTIYLMRHSEPFRKLNGSYNSLENEQIRNEKNILSINGELKAKKMSNLNALCNIDILFSSHYVRAMSTAKYIAEKNNIKLNVDENLGERKFGVNDIVNDILPDFYEKQFLNWNYKIQHGECLNEVSLRMYQIINKIIADNIGKKIVIVTHSTAILAYLKNYFTLYYNKITQHCEVYLNDRLLFDGKFETPHLFKLTFDKNLNITEFKNLHIS